MQTLAVHVYHICVIIIIVHRKTVISQNVVAGDMSFGNLLNKDNGGGGGGGTSYSGGAGGDTTM